MEIVEQPMLSSANASNAATGPALRSDLTAVMRQAAATPRSHALFIAADGQAITESRSDRCVVLDATYRI